MNTFFDWNEHSSSCLVAELKTLMKSKERLLTDLKNDVYHFSEANEVLKKKLEGTDKQLVDSMKQIRTLVKERDRNAWELKELKSAAQLVGMVDPLEGAANQRRLLDRLREAPQKFVSYVSGTTKSYVTSAFSILKIWYPGVDLHPLADGMSADCSDKKFAEYDDEVPPVAHKIVEDIEQEE